MTIYQPIFYSEISSSYLVYDILQNREIAKGFLKEFFNIQITSVDEIIQVVRERSYIGKGSIDLIIEFKEGQHTSAAAVEFKVHDYESATKNQLITYYLALLDDQNYKDIYLMYLTQFNNKNFLGCEGYSKPDTISVFEYTINKQTISLYKDKLFHENWESFYVFIEQYHDSLSKEQLEMLSMQKKWILEKKDKDLKKYEVNVGNRKLEDFFPDLKIDLLEELKFGELNNKNNRELLTIHLNHCNKEQLDKVMKVIITVISSENVNKKYNKSTPNQTKKAVKDFLKQIVEDDCLFKLIPFYADLFNLAMTTPHIQLHGLGTKGFSLKVSSIVTTTELSVCTLWTKNNKLEFGVKR